MILKTVLLIIASQGYQPIEYGHTRKVLESAGIKVEVASNSTDDANANLNPQPPTTQTKPCACNRVPLEYQTVHVDVALSDVDADKYDGIFIIGGPGALKFLDNETTYKIMQGIASSGKPFGGICISPRILAAAGVLDGKKATGWNMDGKLPNIFKEHNVTFERRQVVVYGSLITADGPSAATEFGKAIVTELEKSS